MWGRRFVSLSISATLFPVYLLAQETAVIPNWAAPPYWSPGEATATPAESAEVGPHRAIGAGALAAVPTSPLPFIAVTPCRIVDTRNATKPPGYGPPSLAANAPRDFTLIGQCGLPGTAQAVSLNLTVTNTKGPGHITIYPRGEPQPMVSTLNYIANQTVANAAITALGMGGGITVVAAVSGADLIIDTNGYYAGAANGLGSNTFLGVGAGNFSMTAVADTGIGSEALQHNVDGSYNTAIGFASLLFNTSGGGNVASGAYALLENTTGTGNTAIGYSALSNAGIGHYNTASGYLALYANGAGSANTANGFNALANNFDGNSNVGIGVNAGLNLMTGDNNIYVVNKGLPIESGTIRIGEVALQSRTFVAGIRGVTTDSADAIPVVIDSEGQLGTVASSARLKEEIGDMGDASSRLLKLRPVTFCYKGQAGARTQFGLIAEEVERVLPELVVHSRTGDAETVLYHEMPAMLLNELQKQHKTIERQATAIDGQAAEIEQLRAEIAALQTVVAQRLSHPD